MNVEVFNDTGDFYLYFGATPHAEFLFECVQSTVAYDLPDEAKFLARYNLFKTLVEIVTKMPASIINLLFNVLKQNNGRLSRRVGAKEFSSLTNNEVEMFEVAYQDLFLSDVE